MAASIIYGASTPVWMQPAVGDANLCFTAQDYRFALAMMFPFPGVINSGDFNVSQHGSGDNTIDIAAGVAAIAGTSVTHQGNYLVYNAGTQNLQPPTPPVANPRIDAIVLSIEDGQITGTHQYRWALQTISGAESSSPAVPALPASSILLALIARRPGVVNLLSADITPCVARASNGGVARYPAGGFVPDLNGIVADGVITTAVPANGFSAVANVPSGAGPCIIISGVSDSNNQIQVAVEMANPPRMWMRAKVAGSWLPWMQLPQQPSGTFATSSLAVGTKADGVLAIAPVIPGVVSVASDTYTVLRAGLFHVVASATISGNVPCGAKILVNGIQFYGNYDLDPSNISRAFVAWSGVLAVNNTIKVQVRNQDTISHTFTRACWLSYVGG
jgi:hypothetical protein